MNTVETCITSELAALSGKIGCYYKNLVTGETCTWHGDIPGHSGQRDQAVRHDGGICTDRGRKTGNGSGDHRTPKGLCAVLRCADVSA